MRTRLSGQLGAGTYFQKSSVTGWFWSTDVNQMGRSWVLGNWFSPSTKNFCLLFKQWALPRKNKMPRKIFPQEIKTGSDAIGALGVQGQPCGSGSPRAVSIAQGHGEPPNSELGDHASPQGSAGALGGSSDPPLQVFTGCQREHVCQGPCPRPRQEVLKKKSANDKERRPSDKSRAPPARAAHTPGKPRTQQVAPGKSPWRVRVERRM